MDLTSWKGGVASPGCGRERARSSSESARRPEALELQATQSNP